MLIGITGRPGAGQSAAADYLHSNGFAVLPASSIDTIIGAGDVNIVVPDVNTAAVADRVRSLGGLVIHLVNATAPDRGPDPVIPLMDDDRELRAAAQLRLDQLDALLAEQLAAASSSADPSTTTRAL